MKLFKTILFSLLSVALFGQNKTAMKYAATITKEEAKKHVEYLASDELEGREAGTEGQKRAAVYLSQQFNQYGIAPLNGTYFQRFGLRKIDPKSCSLSIDGKSYKYSKHFLHNSDFADTSFTDAQLVFLGYGVDTDVYSDYKGIDVKGKVVMFYDGVPLTKKGESLFEKLGKPEYNEFGDRKLKVDLAAEKGAVGVVIINERISDMLKKSSTRHFFKKEKMHLKGEPLVMKLPVLSIDDALADSLCLKGGMEKGLGKTVKRMAKKKKPSSLVLNVKMSFKSNMITDDLISENVLGFIEGTDKKEEVIVITAHYDHIGMHHGKIFNGADDDASGTTALLEMAQAFSKAKSEGKGPRRSILFMPVSAEEKGLLGSQYYSEHPLFPLEKTVANLNIDMIGRIDDQHKDGNYIYIIGSDFLSKDLHDINETANKTYTSLELDYKFNNKTDPNRFYYRSDHYNFAKNNVPCIFYFNGVHKDYHKHTDTADKIDFEKMTKITKLVFHTAWELANREERIQLNQDQE